MIIIDGQIGVGKTTLGSILEKTFHIPLFSEITLDDTMVILNKFYNDKPRWSFTSQIHFLVNRLQMIKDLRKKGHGVIDRSIYGDSIFAEMHYEEGLMSNEEFRTYKALLKNLLEQIQPPDYLIYLDCSVDVAVERINMRNRECEKSISREYLTKLNSKYLTWYDEYDSSPKIMIDTNKLNIHKEQDRNTMLSLIEKHIANYIK